MDGTSAAPSRATLATALERFGQLARDCAVVGAQLAVHAHGSLHTREFGREVDGGSEVHSGSAFAYGSTSKTFTAVCALQLVSDGLLTLDDPIRRWVGGADPALDATVRQLLSHTAGLPSDHESHDAGGDPPARRLRALLAAVPPPARTAWPAPGTFSYSNVGYHLLSQLVADATGLSWPETLDTYLLSPLDTRAGFLPGPRPRTAPALTVHGHHIRPPATGHEARTVSAIACTTDSDSLAAGGLAGTATDLVALARLALGNGPDLCDPQVLQEMTTPVDGAEPFGLADGWGLGLGRFGTPGTAWWGHDGTHDGTTCHLRLDSASGTVVALTTNSTTGQQLWDAVLRELADAGLPVGVHRPQLPPEAPVEDFTPCLGEYRNGELGITARLDAGDLILALPGGAAYPATPRADLTFSALPPGHSTPFVGRFLRSPHSPVVLQYNGRTLTRAAPVT
ncbi:serine hydrolase domain-containing protein [Kitasatospora sp. NPDC096077]|uniref:serine hydrolase domain-containing protein n=1 Tax=Kitasatospora sp. NPDC096077 TaxID=3155544 RepID=UPI00332D7B29